MKSFTLNFIAQAHHIDELSHVNNAVWVQWIQDIAGAHWNDTAHPDHVLLYMDGDTARD